MVYLFTPCSPLEYFQLESGEACVKRLKVLIHTNLHLPAHNLAQFAVRHLFAEENNISHADWVPSDRDLILDLYIGLLFKLKKDSHTFHPTVR